MSEALTCMAEYHKYNTINLFKYWGFIHENSSLSII
jgi:hypothetical protein